MKNDLLKRILRRKHQNYEQFHRKTKFRKPGRNLNIKYWPKEWKTIYYKGYARFEEIQLPRPEISETLAFKKVLEERKSQRLFSKKALSSQKLSALLHYSAGISPNKPAFFERRFYPSPGGRFSLEVYVLSLNTDLPKGIYHYYIKNNSLEKLADFRKKDLRTITNQHWAKEAGCLIVFTSIFNRNTMKYGDRGYRHILVEAGHLGQNLYLLATALGLGVCAIGGYVDDKINVILDVDGVEESVVYVLAVGNSPAA